MCNGCVSLEDISATCKAVYICKRGGIENSLLQPGLASHLIAVLKLHAHGGLSLDCTVASNVPQCQLLRGAHPSAVQCTSCAWTDCQLPQM